MQVALSVPGEIAFLAPDPRPETAPRAILRWLKGWIHDEANPN
jgi:hypothetical protein